MNAMGVTPVMRLCVLANVKKLYSLVDFELIKREIILCGSESHESLESARKILLLALKQVTMNSVTARK